MRNLRTRLAKLAVAAVVGASVVVGVPGTASAGTCTTPGCGGEIDNSSGMDVRIANNWCWGVWHSDTYYGDKLPCVDNPGSWGSYRADVELPPGDKSRNHYYYYDTDSVRAYKGCVTMWSGWGSGNTLDRRGKSSMWVKVYDWGHLNVFSIRCG
ncbi:hypothetical protein OG729_01825 [Streptomyces sp. NBC_00210]|uniref:hypothetical protein n=1 Tax=unclassified Streptomyces TaxID=2593676 RepID=UPI0032531405